MLNETMTALAAAGGVAVVQAAGQDAWTSTRVRIARWFGRSGDGREQTALARLDETAAALGADEDTEATRTRLVTMWHTRIETVLEGLAPHDRDAAAEELRTVLAELAEQREVSDRPASGTGGAAVTGGIRAEGGSIAAGVIHGGAHIGPPPPPAPVQG